MKTNDIKDTLKVAFGSDLYNFVKLGSHYTIGNVANQAIAFLALPIFTRLLLPEEYGILALFSAGVSVFAVLFGLQMYGSVGRYYLEKKSDFNQFLGTTFITLFIVFILEGALFYIFRDSIAAFFQISKYLFLLVLIVSGFATINGLYLNLLVVRRESVRYTKFSVFQGFFLIILSIILIVTLDNDKYLGRIYAQILVVTTFAIYFIYKLLPETDFIFRIRHLRYAANYNLPAIPGALSGFLVHTFDRIIISQITTTEKTGLYSLAFNIGMVVNVISSGLFAAWAPQFIEDMRDKKYDSIRRLTDKFADIIISVGLFISILAREMILLLAPSIYHEALDIIPFIALGYVFLFFANVFSFHTSYRKEKIIFTSINLIIIGFLKLALNYALIPIYGYKIAALTTMLLFILLLFLNYIVVRFLLKENVIKMTMFFKKVIIAIVFTSIVLFVSNISNIFFLNFCIRVISVGLWIYLLFGRQLIRNIRSSV